MRLAAVEPHGDLVRLRAAPRAGGPPWVDGLAADVTPAAVAELTLEPGADLWFVVKAAEVGVHAADAGVPAAASRPTAPIVSLS